MEKSPKSVVQPAGRASSSAANHDLGNHVSNAAPSASTSAHATEHDGVELILPIPIQKFLHKSLPAPVLSATPIADVKTGSLNETPVSKRAKRKRDVSEADLPEAVNFSLAQEGPSTRKVKPKKEGEGGRQDNSLSLLTKKFVDLFSELTEPDGSIHLNDAAKRLGVAKRRIYDITNVLEGIDMLEKTKNSVRWRGSGFVSEQQKKEVFEARAQLRELETQEEQLDRKIEQMSRQVQMLLLEKTAYMTHADLLSIPGLKDATVLAIRAPPGTPVEVPLDDNNNPKREILIRGNQPIEVYLVDSDAHTEESHPEPMPSAVVGTPLEHMDHMCVDGDDILPGLRTPSASPLKTPPRNRHQHPPLANTPRGPAPTDIRHRDNDDDVMSEAESHGGIPWPHRAAFAKSNMFDDAATSFLNVNSSPLASPIKMNSLSLPSSPHLSMLANVDSPLHPTSQLGSSPSRFPQQNSMVSVSASPRRHKVEAKHRVVHPSTHFRLLDDDDDYYLRFLQGDEGVTDFYADDLDDSDSFTLTNMSTAANTRVAGDVDQTFMVAL